MAIAIGIAQQIADKYIKHINYSIIRRVYLKAKQNDKQTIHRM